MSFHIGVQFSTENQSFFSYPETKSTALELQQNQIQRYVQDVADHAIQVWNLVTQYNQLIQEHNNDKGDTYVTVRAIPEGFDDSSFYGLVSQAYINAVQAQQAHAQRVVAINLWKQLVQQVQLTQVTATTQEDSYAVAQAIPQSFDESDLRGPGFQAYASAVQAQQDRAQTLAQAVAEHTSQVWQLVAQYKQLVVAHNADQIDPRAVVHSIPRKFELGPLKELVSQAYANAVQAQQDHFQRFSQAHDQNAQQKRTMCAINNRRSIVSKRKPSSSVFKKQALAKEHNVAKQPQLLIALRQKTVYSMMRGNALILCDHTMKVPIGTLVLKVERLPEKNYLNLREIRLQPTEPEMHLDSSHWIAVGHPTVLHINKDDFNREVQAYQRENRESHSLIQKTIQAFVNQANRPIDAVAFQHVPHLLKIQATPSQNEQNLQEDLQLLGYRTFADQVRLGYFQKISRQDKIRYMSHIAAALAQLHEFDYVHNNVALSNILFDHIPDEALLIDCGQIIECGTLCSNHGTYPAPEHFFGTLGSLRTRSSKANDCWAFGISLYALLHGEEALHQLSRALCDKQYRLSIDSTSQIRDQLQGSPNPEEILIVQLLSKIPEDRPSMDIVTQQLQNWRPLSKLLC